jgi:hypothetical protein
MKRTSLSKSVRTIALIIAIASTGVQQPTSAQAQNACSIASAQAPQSTFDGVNLSPAQMSAYDAVIKKQDAQAPRLSAKGKKVIKPNATILFFPKQGVKIPPKLQEALSLEAGNSKPAQIASLTTKYGQYGSFVPSTTVVYTQALFDEFKKEGQILQNRIAAVMNPTQRQKYEQNIAAYERINKACGDAYSPFTKVGNAYEMEGWGL